MYTLWFIFSKYYLPTEFYITWSAMHIGVFKRVSVCLSHDFLPSMKMIQANVNSTLHEDSFYLNWLLYRRFIHIFSSFKIVLSIWTRQSIPFPISSAHWTKRCVFFFGWTSVGSSLCIFFRFSLSISFIIVKVTHISGFLLSLGFVVVICVMVVRLMIGETNGNGNKLNYGYWHKLKKKRKHH